MDQYQRISAANLRIVQALNALDTKTQNALTAAIAALPAPLVIDDAATVAAKTWSSNQITTFTNAQIASAVQAIIGGAGVADDSLKELADKIVALAQADNGLLTFTQGQVLTPAQKTQGCTNLGIGDPDYNFVPAITAALNAGL